MSRTDEIYKPALSGRKIPVLTLDHKWHQLFTQTEPDEYIMRLEDELNGLLKRQGKAKNEIGRIKALKKKLMQEIVENAASALAGNNEKAQKKTAESKRLIEECNEKLNSYEDELLFLPREIDRVNKELMLRTMEICYSRLKENTKEIEENTQWINKTRIELKKRMVRKQEKELMNQELYSYMHDIFGAEVIDIFDMEHQKE